MLLFLEAQMPLDLPVRLVDDFLCDENFLALTELAREQRLLFITDLSETRVSAFLGWLFRPHEGHGLGDQAIRELLKRAWLQVYSADWEGPLPDQMFAGWTPSKIVDRSFRDLCVETEYRFGKATDPNQKNRPVDIVLVSRLNKLVMLIENKFGSRVHGDQLQAYRTQAAASFPGFKILHVYLDPNAENEPDDKPHWIPLRYDWLIDLISAQQKSGLLSDKALDALAQVKDYLVEESADKRDEVVQAYFSALVSDHKRVLEMMRTLGELSRHDRLTAAPPAVSEVLEPLLIEYHQRRRLWDGLFSQMTHLPLIEALRKKVGEDLEIKRYPKWLQMRRRAWVSIRDQALPPEAAWGLRLAAWKSDQKTDTYSVRSVVDFNQVDAGDSSMLPPYSDTQETQLRAVAHQLRKFNRKASKSDRWIRLMEMDALTPDEAAETLAEEFKRIDAALTAANLLNPK